MVSLQSNNKKEGKKQDENSNTTSESRLGDDRRKREISYPKGVSDTPWYM